MGSGAVMRCPKCGFEFHRTEGIGFLFPRVYEETIKKAKDGELGDVLRDFFEKNPAGALNAENITLCCDQCGALSGDMDLTMYTPKDKAKSNRETERRYVTGYELERDYSEVMKYPHKCKKCGGDMHRVTYGERLKCPECKVEMEETVLMCWD